jgi:hypothetical protein
VLRKIATESKNTIQELIRTRRADDLTVTMVA